MVVGNWHRRLPGKLPSSPQGQPYNWHDRLPFHLRTSIINSTGGCLFTFLIFNVSLHEDVDDHLIISGWKNDQNVR